MTAATSTVPAVSAQFGSSDVAACGRLLHSILAHQCALAEADVDFIGALEPACAEAVDALWQGTGRPLDVRVAVSDGFVVSRLRVSGHGHRQLRRALGGSLFASLFELLTIEANEIVAAAPIRPVDPTGTDPPRPLVTPATQRDPAAPVGRREGSRIVIPASFAQLALVRACVLDLIEFDDDEHGSAFLVAVTEILVNSIEATVRQGRDRPVTIDVVTGPRPQVVISDRGGGFSRAPAAVNPRRGAGLRIAKAFVPNLDIRSTPTGTAVIMPVRAP